MTTEPNDKQKQEAREIAAKHSSAAFLRYLGVDPFNELIELFASALAARDTEIRAVLEGLRNISPVDPPCWCRVDFLPKGKHSPACLAARALWNRL